MRDSYSGDAGIDFVLAARKGEISKVDEFLKGGVNVNIRNDKDETPLIGACSAGRIEIAKLLLDKGANPNLTDKEGDTALIWATMELATKSSPNRASDLETIKLIRLLLDRGAAVDVKGESWPALFVATERGNIEVMNLLLDKGADINEKNWAGISALSRAIYVGNKDAAKILLARGADIESRDTSGETPLFVAAPGNTEILPDLLDRGANASATNNRLETPLMRSNNIENVVALLNHGAEIEAKDKSGATALMYAISSRHLEKAKLLLEKGAQVNARNNEGATALKIAKQYSNNRAIIELLLKFGAIE